MVFEPLSFPPPDAAGITSPVSQRQGIGEHAVAGQAPRQCAHEVESADLPPDRIEEASAGLG